MIIILLIFLLVFIYFLNKKEYFENSLSIIDETLTQNAKCYYNNNEQYIGKKYIQKLSDNKFYSICEYSLDNNGNCVAPCLFDDPKCNTTKTPVSLQNDINNNKKCRTVSIPI